MSDRAALLVALAASLGAWTVLPIPRSVAIVLGLCVVVTRAPVVLGLAVFAWAAGSGAVALAVLRAPVPTSPYVGEVTLVGDPVPLTYGARVDLRINGRRYDARVDRRLAREVSTHLAGERAIVKGTFHPRVADAPWLDARHIAGRFQIDAIEQWRAAPPPYAFANALRRTLERGAVALPSQHRALYTGLVYGDDRAQGTLLADDFRAGGLGHLLAVSGQNVAFALAAAGPLLRRVPQRMRWATTLTVLGAFVLVTRAEPSVLRAAAMAAIASRAVSLGRVASGVRVLSLAVTALLCIDPLLVRALGFQLSVAASFGIVLVGPRLVAWLRGPAPLREMLGVTIAAQLAVAPLSVAAFGSVPLASIPANLLALPAAGLVMVWGLTAGLVAGVVGGHVAVVVQLPARVLVWWIATVAERAGAAPLGMLRSAHLHALAVAAACRLVGGRLRWPRAATWRATASCVALVALATPMVAARNPTSFAGRVADGVWLWRQRGVVVEVDGTARPSDALASLRDHDVGAVDVLIVRTTSSAAATVARDLRSRYDPLVLWAPEMHQVRGAVTPVEGESVVVGGLVVTVLEASRGVRVDVRAV